MNQLKIKTWLQKNKKSWQLWVVLILISLTFTFFQRMDNTAEVKNTQSLDTYIPEGFVLVPVELNNSPSLDGLLESKGIVDLYIGDPSSQKAEKVAEAVKIIRSPRNQSHFAVLVPENKASFLIQHFQSFYAVIQNPIKPKKTIIQSLNKKRRRVIVIESEDSLDF